MAFEIELPEKRAVRELPTAILDALITGKISQETAKTALKLSVRIQKNFDRLLEIRARGGSASPQELATVSQQIKDDMLAAEQMIGRLKGLSPAPGT